MTARFTSASTLILSSVLASAAGAQQWTSLGPAPLANGDTGRVAAIVCSPTDADRFFVGGADGGVWRTDDGGTTWQPLTDFEETTAIGALALDPQDEQVIYAGTGEANFANHSRLGLGLLKSTNGGTTWTSMARGRFAGRCFSRIAVSPSDSQMLFASITHAGGFPAKVAAKGHPETDGPIGLFRSRDGGQTWKHLTRGLPALSATDLALDPAQSGVMYAAIGDIFGDSDNGLYKSTDDGVTWAKLGGGLPTTDVGRISVAIAASQPQRVYALITQAASSTGGSAATRGVYRSDDGGATWIRISNRNIQASYGWYLCTIGVDPTDPDIVYTGGVSLRRSLDGGSSWQSVTPPHVDLHAITFDPLGRVLVGDDGGVHRRRLDDSGWDELNDGLGLIQFYAGLSLHPSDRRIIFGGTQDNGSNRRDTDTESWESVFGGDGGWTQLDRSNPETVFVEFQGTGNLYRSTDGGDQFSYVGSDISGGDRNCFLPPFLIDPLDSRRMLYGTQRVWASSDRGLNWTAQSGDLTTGTGAIRALAQCETQPDTVWAATNDGHVAVSHDGAATFQTVLPGHDGWPRVTREIAAHPTRSNEAWLVTARYDSVRVRWTDDSGMTWRDADASLPERPVNAVAVDVSNGRTTVFVGTEVGVYRSDDRGAIWQRVGFGLPHAPVIDVLVDRSHGRLVVATQGRGAWSVPLIASRASTPRRLR